MIVTKPKPARWDELEFQRMLREAHAKLTKKYKFYNPHATVNRLLVYQVKPQLRSLFIEYLLEQQYLSRIRSFVVAPKSYRRKVERLIKKIYRITKELLNLDVGYVRACTIKNDSKLITTILTHIEHMLTQGRSPIAIKTSTMRVFPLHVSFKNMLRKIKEGKQSNRYRYKELSSTDSYVNKLATILQMKEIKYIDVSRIMPSLLIVVKLSPDYTYVDNLLKILMTRKEEFYNEGIDEEEVRATFQEIKEGKETYHPVYTIQLIFPEMIRPSNLHEYLTVFEVKDIVSNHPHCGIPDSYYNVFTKKMDRTYTQALSIQRRICLGTEMNENITKSLVHINIIDYIPVIIEALKQANPETTWVDPLPQVISRPHLLKRHINKNHK